MVALYTQPINETVTLWWERVLTHTDRFFEISHSFNAEMGATAVAALMIEMAQQRDAVANVKYATITINARAHLLDAMAYTLLGVSATMVQKAGLAQQHLASAQQHLNILMQILDNAAA